MPFQGTLFHYSKHFIQFNFHNCKKLSKPNQILRVLNCLKYDQKSLFCINHKNNYSMENERKFHKFLTIRIYLNLRQCSSSTKHTTTVNQSLEYYKNKLSDAQIPEPELSTEYIISHVLQISRVSCYSK